MLGEMSVMERKWIKVYLACLKPHFPNNANKYLCIHFDPYMLFIFFLLGLACGDYILLLQW